MPQDPNNASNANFTRQVLIAVALVALAALLWKIAPVFMLFFAGIVVATAIRAGSRPLVRHLHMSPTVAVAVVFILLILLLMGGSYLFGKQVQAQTEAFWLAITEAWTKVREYIESTPI